MWNVQVIWQGGWRMAQSRSWDGLTDRYNRRLFPQGPVYLKKANDLLALLRCCLLAYLHSQLAVHLANLQHMVIHKQADLLTVSGLDA